MNSVYNLQLKCILMTLILFKIQINLPSFSMMIAKCADPDAKL